MKRIVVGVKKSPASCDALCWAYGSAVRQDSVLEAITAYEPIVAVSPFGGHAIFDGASAYEAACAIQHEVLLTELGQDAFDPRNSATRRLWRHHLGPRRASATRVAPRRRPASAPLEPAPAPVRERTLRGPCRLSRRHRAPPGTCPGVWHRSFPPTHRTIRQEEPASIARRRAHESMKHGRHRPPRVRSRWIVAVVSIAALASVCGGGSRPSASRSGAAPESRPVAPGARVIAVSARSFKFAPNTIQIGAGEDVAIQLHAEDAYHTFTVQGIGTIVSTPATTTRTGGLRIDRPGRYIFYCDVPGHRAAGMEGTIIVSPKVATARFRRLVGDE